MLNSLIINVTAKANDTSQSCSKKIASIPQDIQSCQCSPLELAVNTCISPGNTALHPARLAGPPFTVIWYCHWCFFILDQGFCCFIWGSEIFLKIWVFLTLVKFYKFMLYYCVFRSRIQRFHMRNVCAESVASTVEYCCCRARLR